MMCRPAVSQALLESSSSLFLLLVGYPAPAVHSEISKVLQFLIPSKIELRNRVTGPSSCTLKVCIMGPGRPIFQSAHCRKIIHRAPLRVPDFTDGARVDSFATPKGALVKLGPIPQALRLSNLHPTASGCFVRLAS